MTTTVAFDARELESKVKEMYRDVAERPHGAYHFEMGRALAERLGYPPADLDRIPREAIDSFAGVGHYFHLAALRDRDGFANVTYVKGYIEEVPLPPSSADCVISNGVINLSADKPKVFREAARLLRPGGRLAIADIVTDVKLPETITCNTTLWAACIGGAAQREDYRGMIEAAGLHVTAVEENSAYRFISDNALGATRKYGVKSISLRAEKPRVG